ncbi:helix-turn-helix domain-containing protein [Myceligenerans pegani]|uniref:Helix-turn-helix domain-containing protein n=1 Tax=Myceligenerans pegani TaxID=2776917 RepID=A0ABR9N418_9MICO|nr:helix-turn-helix transcriptional regulator [Myceligenerans sp. TRM 65318]MBE1878416.1 helix-turn-helix domain-containing protein [Myceligenerans sp. TRM 65318]MBE3020687.1 helix-turn-helix domain-containing protein [Myceligenerans sp. TRM 65318]
MRRTTNALGTYLRARRELVTPRQVGLPDAGVRRVPGLRREEVAMLAGISADYYLRLERGRDRNPSVQVLESIARVLRLDDDHFAHLLTLVGEVPGRYRARSREETPSAGVLKLLGSLAQPAFIENRYFDILAANPPASALDPRLVKGGNQLRDLFLDPSVQALYPEWKSVTECFVANLRQVVGNDVDDPRLVALTDELSQASPYFRGLWARHEVRGQRGTPIRIDHPRVGELTLNRERLSIGGAEDLMLVVHHPDAGSGDAARLALLASTEAPGLPASAGRAGRVAGSR